MRKSRNSVVSLIWNITFDRNNLIEFLKVLKFFKINLNQILEQLSTLFYGIRIFKDQIWYSIFSYDIRIGKQQKRYSSHYCDCVILSAVIYRIYWTVWYRTSASACKFKGSALRSTFMSRRSSRSSSPHGFHGFSIIYFDEAEKETSGRSTVPPMPRAYSL